MHHEVVRYRLTQEQVSALACLIGVVPDGRFVVAEGTAGSPLAVLKGSALLDEAGSRPVPILESAIRVIAAPRRVLTARVCVPGVDEWDFTHVSAGATGGPYVMVSAADGDLDLLVMSSEYEVAAVLDGLFDLTTLPSRPVVPDVVVPFDGWVGVLAATDLRRSMALASQLDRERTPPLRFDGDTLALQVATGVASGDSRWAVTAFTPLSPFELRTAPPSANALVRGLRDAGLAEADRAHLRPTPLGENLIGLCEGVIKWGAVTLTFTGSSPNVRMGELTVVRAPLRFGLGFWNGDNGTREMTLVEPESEAAVEMLRRMLLIPEPVASAVSEGFLCPQCGFEVDLELGPYCSSCGARATPSASRGGAS